MRANSAASVIGKKFRERKDGGGAARRAGARAAASVGTPGAGANAEQGGGALVTDVEEFRRQLGVALLARKGEGATDAKELLRVWDRSRDGAAAWV